MGIFLVAITVTSASLMVIVILLQQSKGGDLGSAFGRGSRGALYDAPSRANFLTRTTSVLATIFFLSALALSVFVNSNVEDGVLQSLRQGQENARSVNDALDNDPEGKELDEADAAKSPTDTPD